ncbi:hypothetical protein ACHAXR_006625 [Thalassiosira sp. AJA248-18]
MREIRKNPTSPCPFCRAEAAVSNELTLKRIKKRMEVNDAEAFHLMGVFYEKGIGGLPQDTKKAVELKIRAGELGSYMAQAAVGSCYLQGRGVERDEKKANRYFQLAAMAGHDDARYNLGSYEQNCGNKNRALKHWMVGARAGDKDCMGLVQKGYMDGDVTKCEFEHTLRGHQHSIDEMKQNCSPHRLHF